MPSFKDSLIIMAHGINSDRYTWGDADEEGNIEFNDPDLWGGYLINQLRIPKQYLQAYSFSSRSGRHEENMLELGYGGYENPAGGDTETNGVVKQKFVAGVKVGEILGNSIGLNGEIVVKETQVKSGISEEKSHSWLEQAKAEYRQALFGDFQINKEDPITKKRVWEHLSDIPDAILPSKLVMVAHSQGNFAVRGYIHSGELARKGVFDPVVGKNGFSDGKLSEIKENPLGFYDWPVEKVVFINPPLKGSDMAWV